MYGWCHLRSHGTRPLGLSTALSLLALSTGGLYGRLMPGSGGIGAFHRNGSQMEAPGGAGTSLDIPLEEVLRVVTPPAEAVIPYPGVCSKIWLHDVGGVDGGTPTHLQCGFRLQHWQQKPTPVAASSSWSRVTTSGSKQLLSLGGSTCRPATTSWTKAAQSDRLIPMKISQETSLRSHPPSRRGNDKEGAGSQDIYLLVTQRGEPLERSLEGIDIPPSTLAGLYCLWEGLPEGVLPGLHFDVFPPTTIEI